MPVEHDEADELRERRDHRHAGGTEPEVQPHTNHLLALRTAHMEVTIADCRGDPGHVFLSILETRGRRTCAAKLTALELDVLAHGLARVADRMAHDRERR